MPRIHPQIPYEIIQLEVLPRLPAKSIGRLRCVCKAWHSFISTPDFTRMHLRYQTNYKLLLLDLLSPTFRTLDRAPLNHDSIITTRPLPFNDDAFVIASLDGLVCVCLEKTLELAFWNPLTGAYKKFRACLFTDICNGAFAFYRDSSNDYKLLHIVSEGAFIYSQRFDSWSYKINTSLESYNISSFKWLLATFVAGKVYFMLQSRSTIRLQCLMSFDVESENFKEIQFPHAVLCGTHLRASLVALNDCIHLCVAYGDNYMSLECDMWRMDGEGWIKVVAFASPRWQPFRDIYTKKNGNWLAIWKDDNCIKNIGLDDFATDLYGYYIGHCTNLYHHHQVVYIETLVSPNP